MTLTVLRSAGQVFCRLSLNWDLSDGVLMIRLKLWDFRKKTTEVKCHSQHIIFQSVSQKGILPGQLINLYIDLDYLTWQK